MADDLEIQFQEQQKQIEHLKEMVRDREQLIQLKDKELQDTNAKLSKVKLQAKAKVAKDARKGASKSEGAEKQALEVSSEDISATDQGSSKGKLLLLRKKIDEKEKIIADKSDLLSQKEVQIQLKMTVISKKDELIKSLRTQLEDKAKVTDSFEKVYKDYNDEKSLENNVEEMYAQMVYKDKKLMELNNKILEQDRIVMDLQELVSEKNEVINGRDKVVKILQDTIKEKDQHAQGQAAVITKLTGKVENSEELISSLQEQLEKAEHELRIETDKFHMKITETQKYFEETIQDREAENQKLRETLKSKDQDLSTAENDLCELLSRHEREVEKIMMQGDISRDEVLKILEHKLKDVNEVLSGKIKVIEVLQTESSVKDKELLDMNNTAKRLKEKLQITSEQLMMLQTEYADHEKQWKQEQEKKELKLKNVVEKYEHEKSEKDLQLHAYQSSLSQFESAYNQAVTEYSKLQDRYTQAYAEKQTLLSHLNYLGAQQPHPDLTLELSQDGFSQLQKEVAELKAQLETKCKDLEEKEKEVETSKGHIEELNKLVHAESGSEVNETGKLTTKIKALEDEIESICQNNDLANEVLRLRNHIAELEDDKGNLQLKLVDFEETVALQGQLQDQLQNFEIELKIVQQEKESEMMLSNEEKDKLNQIIQEQQASIDQSHREDCFEENLMKELKEEVSDLKTVISQLQDDKDKEKRIRIHMESQLMEYEDYKKQVETDTAANSEKIASLQSEIEHLCKEIETKEQRISVIESDRVALEIKMAEIEESREGDQDKHKVLNAEIIKLKEKIDNQHQPVIAFEEENEELQQTLELEKSTNHKLQSQVQELERTTAEQLETIDHKERIEEKYLGQISELQEEIHKYELEKQAADTQHQIALSECLNLLSQVAHLEQSLIRKDVILGNLQKKIDFRDNEVKQFCIEISDGKHTTTTALYSYIDEKMGCFSKLSEDYDVQKSVLVELESSLQVAENTIDAIQKHNQTELEDMSSNLRSLEMDIQNLNETVFEKETTIIEIHSLLKNKEKELCDTKQMISMKDVKISELQQEIQQYSCELNTLNERQCGKDNEFCSKIRSCSEQISELEIELNRQIACNRSLKESEKDYRIEIQCLNEQLNVANLELKSKNSLEVELNNFEKIFEDIKNTNEESEKVLIQKLESEKRSFLNTKMVLEKNEVELNCLKELFSEKENQLRLAAEKSKNIYCCLKEKTSLVDELRKLCSSKNLEISESNSKINELSFQIVECEAENKEISTFLGEKESQLVAISEKCSSLEEQCNLFLAENDKISKERCCLSEQITSLQLQIEHKDKELQCLSDKHDSYKLEYEKMVDNQNLKIKSLTDNLLELNEEMIELKKVEYVNKPLQEACTALSNKNSLLSNQLEEHEHTVLHTENEKISEKAQLDESQAQVRQLSNDFDVLLQEKDALRTEQADLLNRMETERDMLMNKVSDLEELTNTRHAEIVSVRSALCDVNSILDSVKLVNEQLEAEKSHFVLQISDLEHECESKNANILSLSSTLNNCKSDFLFQTEINNKMIEALSVNLHDLYDIIPNIVLTDSQKVMVFPEFFKEDVKRLLEQHDLKVEQIQHVLLEYTNHENEIALLTRENRKLIVSVSSLECEVSEKRVINEELSESLTHMTESNKMFSSHLQQYEMQVQSLIQKRLSLEIQKDVLYHKSLALESKACGQDHSIQKLLSTQYKLEKEITRTQDDCVNISRQIGGYQCQLECKDMSLIKTNAHLSDIQSELDEIGDENKVLKSELAESKEQLRSVVNELVLITDEYQHCKTVLLETRQQMDIIMDRYHETEKELIQSQAVSVDLNAKHAASEKQSKTECELEKIRQELADNKSINKALKEKLQTNHVKLNEVTENNNVIMNELMQANDELIKRDFALKETEQKMIITQDILNTTKNSLHQVEAALENTNKEKNSITHNFNECENELQILLGTQNEMTNKMKISESLNISLQDELENCNRELNECRAICNKMKVQLDENETKITDIVKHLDESSNKNREMALKLQLKDASLQSLQETVDNNKGFELYCGHIKTQLNDTLMYFCQTEYDWSACEPILRSLLSQSDLVNAECSLQATGGVCAEIASSSIRSFGNDMKERLCCIYSYLVDDYSDVPTSVDKTSHLLFEDDINNETLPKIEKQLELLKYLYGLCRLKLFQSQEIFKKHCECITEKEGKISQMETDLKMCRNELSKLSVGSIRTEEKLKCMSNELYITKASLESVKEHLIVSECQVIDYLFFVEQLNMNTAVTPVSGKLVKNEQEQMIVNEKCSPPISEKTCSYEMKTADLEKINSEGTVECENQDTSIEKVQYFETDQPSVYKSSTEQENHSSKLKARMRETVTPECILKDLKNQSEQSSMQVTSSKPQPAGENETCCSALDENYHYFTSLTEELQERNCAIGPQETESPENYCLINQLNNSVQNLQERLKHMCLQNSILNEEISKQKEDMHSVENGNLILSQCNLSLKSKLCEDGENKFKYHVNENQLKGIKILKQLRETLNSLQKNYLICKEDKEVVSTTLNKYITENLALNDKIIQLLSELKTFQIGTDVIKKEMCKLLMDCRKEWHVKHSIFLEDEEKWKNVMSNLLLVNEEKSGEYRSTEDSIIHDEVNDDNISSPNNESEEIIKYIQELSHLKNKEIDFLLQENHRLRTESDDTHEMLNDSTQAFWILKIDYEELVAKHILQGSSSVNVHQYLDLASKEIKKLKLSLCEKENLIVELNLNISALSSFLEETQNNNRRIQTDMENVLLRNEELTGELNEIIDQNKETTVKICQLEDSSKYLTEDLSKKEGQIETLTNEIRTLQKQCAELKVDLGNVRDDSETSQFKLKHTLNCCRELEHQASELRTKNVELVDNLEKQSKVYEDLLEEDKILKCEGNEKEERINSLEDLSNTLSSEKDCLNRELGHLKEKLENYENELQKLNIKCNHLEKFLNENNVKHSEEKTEIQNAVETLESLKNELQNRLEDVSREREELSSKMAEITSQLNRFQELVVEKDSQLEILTLHSVGLEREMFIMNRTVCQLNLQLHQMVKENVKLNNCIVNDKELLSALQSVCIAAVDKFEVTHLEHIVSNSEQHEFLNAFYKSKGAISDNEGSENSKVFVETFLQSLLDFVEKLCCEKTALSSEINRLKTSDFSHKYNFESLEGNSQKVYVNECTIKNINEKDILCRFAAEVFGVLKSSKGEFSIRLLEDLEKSLCRQDVCSEDVTNISLDSSVATVLENQAMIIEFIEFCVYFCGRHANEAEYMTFCEAKSVIDGDGYGVCKQSLRTNSSEDSAKQVSCVSTNFNLKQQHVDNESQFCVLLSHLEKLNQEVVSRDAAISHLVRENSCLSKQYKISKKSNLNKSLSLKNSVEKLILFSYQISNFFENIFGPDNACPGEDSDFIMCQRISDEQLMLKAEKHFLRMKQQIDICFTRIKGCKIDYDISCIEMKRLRDQMKEGRREISSLKYMISELKSVNQDLHLRINQMSSDADNCDSLIKTLREKKENIEKTHIVIQSEQKQIFDLLNLLNMEVKKKLKTTETVAENCSLMDLLDIMTVSDNISGFENSVISLKDHNSLRTDSNVSDNCTYHIDIENKCNMANIKCYIRNILLFMKTRENEIESLETKYSELSDLVSCLQQYPEKAEFVESDLCDVRAENFQKGAMSESYDVSVNESCLLTAFADSGGTFFGQSRKDGNFKQLSMNAKYKHLHFQMAALKVELEKKENEMTLLKVELQEKDAKFADEILVYTLRDSKYDEERISLLLKIDHLIKEGECCNSEIEKQNEVILVMRQELEHGKSKIGDLNKQLKKRDGKIASLNKKLGEMKVLCDNLEKEGEGKILDHQTHLTDKENHLRQLVEENSDLKDNLNKHIDEIRYLGKKVQTLENDIQSCYSDKSCFEDAVCRLESSNTVLQDQISEQNDRLSESRQIRIKLEKDIERLKRMEFELTSVVEKYTEERQVMLNQIQTLTSEINDKENIVQSVYSEKYSLLSDLGDAQFQIKNLNLQLNMSSSLEKRTTESTVKNVETDLSVENSSEFSRCQPDQSVSSDGADLIMPQFEMSLKKEAPPNVSSEHLHLCMSSSSVDNKAVSVNKTELDEVKSQQEPFDDLKKMAEQIESLQMLLTRKSEELYYVDQDLRREWQSNNDLKYAIDEKIWAFESLEAQFHDAKETSKSLMYDLDMEKKKCMDLQDDKDKLQEEMEKTQIMLHENKSCERDLEKLNDNLSTTIVELIEKLEEKEKRVDSIYTEKYSMLTKLGEYEWEIQCLKEQLGASLSERSENVMEQHSIFQKECENMLVQNRLLNTKNNDLQRLVYQKDAKMYSLKRLLVGKVSESEISEPTVVQSEVDIQATVNVPEESLTVVLDDADQLDIMHHKISYNSQIPAIRVDDYSTDENKNVCSKEDVKNPDESHDELSPEKKIVHLKSELASLKDEKHMLSKEIRSKQTNLEQVQCSFDEARKQKMVLETDMMNMKKQSKKKEAKVISLSKQLETLGAKYEKEIQLKEQKLTEYTQEVESLMLQIKKIEECKTAQAESLKDLTSQLEYLNSTNEAKSDKTSYLSQKITDLRKMLEKKREEYFAELQYKDEHIKNLKSQIDELNENLITANHDLVEARAKVDSLFQELEVKSECINSIQTELNNMKGLKETLAHDLFTNNQYAETLQAELDKMEYLKKDLEVKSSELEELTTTCRRLQDENQVFQQELMKKNNDVSLADSEIKHLMNDLDVKCHQVHEGEQSYLIQTKHIETLEEEKKVLLEKVQLKSNSIENLEADLADLHAIYSQKSKAFQQLQIQVGECDAVIQQLSVSNKEHQMCIKDLETKLYAVQNDNGRLQTELLEKQQWMYQMESECSKYIEEKQTLSASLQDQFSAVREKEEELFLLQDHASTKSRLLVESESSISNLKKENVTLQTDLHHSSENIEKQNEKINELIRNIENKEWEITSYVDSMNKLNTENSLLIAERDNFHHTTSQLQNLITQRDQQVKDISEQVELLQKSIIEREDVIREKNEEHVRFLSYENELKTDIQSKTDIIYQLQSDLASQVQQNDITEEDVHGNNACETVKVVEIETIKQIEQIPVYTSPPIENYTEEKSFQDEVQVDSVFELNVLIKEREQLLNKLRQMESENADLKENLSKLSKQLKKKEGKILSLSKQVKSHQSVQNSTESSHLFVCDEKTSQLQIESSKSKNLLPDLQGETNSHQSNPKTLPGYCFTTLHRSTESEQLIDGHMEAFRQDKNLTESFQNTVQETDTSVFCDDGSLTSEKTAAFQKIVDDEERELEVAIQEKTHLKTEISRQGDEINEILAQNEKLLADHSKLLQTLEDKSNNLLLVNQEVDELKQKIRKSTQETENKKTELESLQAVIAESNTQMEQLEELNSSLTNEMVQKEKDLLLWKQKVEHLQESLQMVESQNESLAELQQKLEEHAKSSTEKSNIITELQETVDKHNQSEQSLKFLLQEKDNQLAVFLEDATQKGNEIQSLETTLQEIKKRVTDEELQGKNNLDEYTTKVEMLQESLEQKDALVKELQNANINIVGSSQKLEKDIEDLAVQIQEKNEIIDTLNKTLSEKSGDHEGKLQELQSQAETYAEYTSQLQQHVQTITESLHDAQQQLEAKTSALDNQVIEKEQLIDRVEQVRCELESQIATLKIEKQNIQFAMNAQKQESDTALNTLTESLSDEKAITLDKDKNIGELEIQLNSEKESVKLLKEQISKKDEVIGSYLNQEQELLLVNQELNELNQKIRKSTQETENKKTELESLQADIAESNTQMEQLEELNSSLTNQMVQKEKDLLLWKQKVQHLQESSQLIETQNESLAELQQKLEEHAKSSTEKSNIITELQETVDKHNQSEQSLKFLLQEKDNQLAVFLEDVTQKGNEIQSLETTLQEIKKRVTDEELQGKTNLDEYTTKVEMLQESLEQKDALVKELQNANINIVGSSQKLEKDIEDLAVQIQEKNEFIDTLNKTLSEKSGDHEGKLQELQSQAETYAEYTSQLQQHVQTITESLHDAQQQLEAKTSALDNQVIEKEQLIDRVEQVRCELESQIATLKIEKQNIQFAMNAQKQESDTALNTLTESLSDEKAITLDKDKNIGELEIQLNSEKESVKLLKEQISKKDEIIGSYLNQEQELLAATQLSNELNQQIYRYEEAAEHIHAELDTVKSSNSECDNKMAEMERAKESLVSQIAKLESDLISWKQKAEQLQEYVQTLERENESNVALQEKLEELQNEVVEKRKTVNELQHNVNISNQQLEHSLKSSAVAKESLLASSMKDSSTSENKIMSLETALKEMVSQEEANLAEYMNKIQNLTDIVQQKDSEIKVLQESQNQKEVTFKKAIASLKILKNREQEYKEDSAKLKLQVDELNNQLHEKNVIIENLNETSETHIDYSELIEKEKKLNELQSQVQTYVEYTSQLQQHVQSLTEALHDSQQQLKVKTMNEDKHLTDKDDLKDLLQTQREQFESQISALENQKHEMQLKLSELEHERRESDLNITTLTENLSVEKSLVVERNVIINQLEIQLANEKESSKLYREQISEKDKVIDGYLTNQQNVTLLNEMMHSKEREINELLNNLKTTQTLLVDKDHKLSKQKEEILAKDEKLIFIEQELRSGKKKQHQLIQEKETFESRTVECILMTESIQAAKDKLIQEVTNQPEALQLFNQVMQDINTKYEEISSEMAGLQEKLRISENNQLLKDTLIKKPQEENEMFPKQGENLEDQAKTDTHVQSYSDQMVEYAGRLKEPEERYANLQEELKKTTSERDKLQLEVDKLNKELCQHSKDVNYIDSNITSVQEALEKKDDIIQSLNEKVQHNEDALNNTRLERDHLQLKCIETEKEIFQQVENTNVKADTIESLQKSLQEKDEAIQQINFKMQESTEAIQLSRLEKEELLQKITELESGLYEQTQDIYEKQTTIGSLKNELVEKDELIRRLYLEMTESASFKNLLEESSHKNKELENILKQTNDSYTKLQSDYEMLKSDYAKIAQQRKLQEKILVDEQEMQPITEKLLQREVSDVTMHASALPLVSEVTTGSSEACIVEDIIVKDETAILMLNPEEEMKISNQPPDPTETWESLGILQEKYDKQVADYENISSKLQVSEVKLGKLLIKLKAFKEKNDKLESEVENLTSQLQIYETKNSELLETIVISEDSLNQEKLKYEMLKEDYVQIKQENDTKQMSSIALDPSLPTGNDFDELVSSNNELKNKYSELEQIVTESNTIQEKYAQLQISYHELENSLKLKDQQFKDDVMEIRSQCDILNEQIKINKKKYDESIAEKECAFQQEISKLFELKSQHSMILKDNEDFQKLIDNLKDANSDLRQDTDRMRRSVHDLQSQLSDESSKDSKITSLEHKLSDLEAEKVHLEDEIDEMREEIISSRKDKAAQKEEINNLNSQLQQENKMSEEMNNVSEQLRQLKVENQFLRDEIDGLNWKLEDMAAYEEELEKAQAEIQDLEGGKNMLEVEMKHLKTLTEQIDPLMKEMDNLHSQVQSYETEREVYETELLTLRNKLEHFEPLEKELEMIRSELVSKEHSCKSLKNEVNSLNQKNKLLSHIEDTNKSAVEEIRVTRAESSDLKQEVRELKSRVKAFDKVEEEYNSICEQYNNILADNSNLAKQVEELHNKLKQYGVIEKEILSEQEQREHVEREKATLIGRVEDLQSQNQSLAEEESKLRQKLVDVQNEMQKTNFEYKSLKSQWEVISSGSDKLNKFQSEYENLQSQFTESVEQKNKIQLELNQAKYGLQQRETRCQQLAMQISQLAEDRSYLNIQLSNYSKSMREKEQMGEEVQNQYSVLYQAHMALQAKLKETEQKTIADTLQRVSTETAKTENEELQKQLTEYKMMYENICQSYDSVERELVVEKERTSQLRSSFNEAQEHIELQMATGRLQEYRVQLGEDDIEDRIRETQPMLSHYRWGYCHRLSRWIRLRNRQVSRVMRLRPGIRTLVWAYFILLHILIVGSMSGLL